MSKIEETLAKIIDLFKGKDLPEAILSSIELDPSIPSYKWSMANKILMWERGTSDARGIKMWNQIGRKVKKDSTAFYIFAPRLVKVLKDEYKEKIEGSTRKEQKSSKLALMKIKGCCDQKFSGYTVVPVFAVEDTEGKEVNYKKTRKRSFNLENVAKKIGITVMVTPENYSFRGIYNRRKKTISICTDDSCSQKTFYHELAHAVHDHLGMMKKSYEHNEIVAELSAQALSLMLDDLGLPKTVGNSYKYISNYVKDKTQIVSECIKVLTDVNKVLTFILENSK